MSGGRPDFARGATPPTQNGAEDDGRLHGVRRTRARPSRYAGVVMTQPITHKLGGRSPGHNGTYPGMRMKKMKPRSETAVRAATPTVARPDGDRPGEALRRRLARAISRRSRLQRTESGFESSESVTLSTGSIIRSTESDTLAPKCRFLFPKSRSFEPHSGFEASQSAFDATHSAFFGPKCRCFRPKRRSSRPAVDTLSTRRRSLRRAVDSLVPQSGSLETTVDTLRPKSRPM